MLMVLAILYYGFLAAWSLSSPSHVVRNIASLLPFWLVYGLLLANTAVCLLGARLRQLRRRLGPGLTREGEPPDWTGSTGTRGTDQVARRLRRLGYRVTPGPDGGLTGVARRFSPLGTYLFHGAFFLVALGFLLTLAARQEIKGWAAVGETFTGEAGQVLSRSAPRLLTRPLPPPSFRLDRVHPEFWRDQLLFTTLEADLTLPDGRRATTRINRPLWFGWSGFLRLSGFGYTPRYELADRDGNVLDSAFVKLNVFPPGQRDFFQLPGYPHRFYLEILPDFAVAGGEAVTRSLNLVNPAVRLHVYRGRLDLGEAILRQADGFAFEGLTLRFPEIRYWGELTLVRDPGAPLLFTGYLLGLAGLLLKLRGARREIGWHPAEEASAPGRIDGWGGRRPAWAAAAEPPPGGRP